MKKIIFQVVIVAVIIILIFLILGDFEEYFKGLLRSLERNKFEYSIFSFLILVSDVILPVPSSIIMFSNGYVLGAINGFILSYIAANIGAVFGYYLGKLATGRSGIRVNPDANDFLSKYGYMAIILSRGVPILSESISIVCGYNRLGNNSYILLNMVGYLPVCVVYSWLGSIDTTGNWFLVILFALGFISVIFWYLEKRLDWKTK